MQELIKTAIHRALPDASVLVESEDGTHWTAVVISGSFEGMMLVRQHQAVLNALKDDFDSERLHALQLKTFTPAKWEELQAQRSPLQSV